MICFFFTLVAPSHRDEAGQVAPPNENASEQLLLDDPDHLEPFLAVDLADGGNYQVVVVLKNLVSKASGNWCFSQLAASLAGLNLSCVIRPDYTGIPYRTQTLFARKVLGVHDRSGSACKSKSITSMSILQRISLSDPAGFAERRGGFDAFKRVAARRRGHTAQLSSVLLTAWAVAKIHDRPYR
jgi:hypothetical protein